VFLQTKFTFLRGQDHRLPYDPAAPIGEQVAQSFASSLEHLGVSTIDSYVLHGPSQSDGLGEADRAAWRAMESLHGAGKVRWLGISNVIASQLDELAGLARVKPTFVQNRCYAERAWDHAVRAVCARHRIVYQGFSLLTANRRVLESPSVRVIAERHGRTGAQVVFRFALELGMLPLTGTSDPEHMAMDLEVYDFSLERAELETIARAGRA
jgi:diketogulonate reductase-like aldo/keto reductase